MGPGDEGWGGGWGEAKPRLCLSVLRNDQSPTTGLRNQGDLPSLLSVPRVSWPFVLELTMCLSPPVLPSFLTSLQTACDGRVLWVATLLLVDSVEADGKSQPSVTTPFCVTRLRGCSSTWG